MRRIKRRSAEKSIAVIIDGKDEKIVPGNDKGHYPNMAMKKATIKPDLPRKSVEGTVCFGRTETCYGNPLGLSIILDMDSIIKDHQEFERFRVY